MLFQPDSVRHEFPLRAAYSRGVLRHVAGFIRHIPVAHPSGQPAAVQPRVLRLLSQPPTTMPHKTPHRHTAVSSSLPGRSLLEDLRPSSRRFRALHPLCAPTLTASSSHLDQEPQGLPEFYDVSLSACHGLRTPPDLHILANADASVLPSVHVKTLGVRN